MNPHPFVCLITFSCLLRKRWYYFSSAQRHLVTAPPHDLDAVDLSLSFAPPWTRSVCGNSSIFIKPYSYNNEPIFQLTLGASHTFSFPKAKAKGSAPVILFCRSVLALWASWRLHSRCAILQKQSPSQRHRVWMTIIFRTLGSSRACLSTPFTYTLRSSPSARLERERLSPLMDCKLHCPSASFLRSCLH